MGLSRDQICRLIPHSGAMCLLDEVLEWDDARIHCRSASHRNAANPLLKRGRLHALCGIEYAAQAMAVHGALVNPSAERRRGYLATARGVTMSVERLDDLAGDLFIRCERLMGSDLGLSYDFQVGSEQSVLLAGRALVMLAGD